MKYIWSIWKFSRKTLLAIGKTWQMCFYSICRVMITAFFIICQYLFINHQKLPEKYGRVHTDLYDTYVDAAADASLRQSMRLLASPSRVRSDAERRRSSRNAWFSVHVIGPAGFFPTHLCLTAPLVARVTEAGATIVIVFSQAHLLRSTEFATWTLRIRYVWH